MVSVLNTRHCEMFDKIKIKCVLGKCLVANKMSFTIDLYTAFGYKYGTSNNKISCCYTAVSSSSIFFSHNVCWNTSAITSTTTKL